MPQLMSSRKAAEMLGKSPATLKRWRYEGVGPDYVVTEGSVSYDVAVLEEYIRKNTRVPSVRAAMENARVPKSGDLCSECGLQRRVPYSDRQRCDVVCRFPLGQPLREHGNLHATGTRDRIQHPANCENYSQCHGQRNSLQRARTANLSLNRLFSVFGLPCVRRSGAVNA